MLQPKRPRVPLTLEHALDGRILQVSGRGPDHADARHRSGSCELDQLLGLDAAVAQRTHQPFGLFVEIGHPEIRRELGKQAA